MDQFAWWQVWGLGLVVLVVFFMIPLGYGWVFRRWGAPDPFVSRWRSPPGSVRRDVAGAGRPGSGAAPARGWGALAIFMWAVFVALLVWLIITLAL